MNPHDLFFTRTRAAASGLALLAIGALAAPGCAPSVAEPQASASPTGAGAPKPSAPSGPAPTTAPAPTPAPDSKPAPATKAPSGQGAAAAGRPSAAALGELLCADRAPCHASNVHPAGTSSEGLALTVVELALHDRGEEGRQVAHDADCAPFEYWLVRSRGPAPVSRQLLWTACNDGYGMAGMGEDEYEVEPGRFRFRRNGGSNWRWSRSGTIALDALRVVSEHDSGWWSISTNSMQSQWSWERFGGRVNWSAPECNADGQVPDVNENDDLPTYSYEPIPLVELDAAYRAGGWKTTSPGDCSVRVDSAGNAAGEAYAFGQGFVTHGAPGQAADASFRALMASPTELFVEVRDDVFVSGAKSWLHDDHLELWVGPPYDYSDHCIPAESDGLYQWGIGVLDGKVHGAYGKPKASPRVERADVREGDRLVAVRLKVTFDTAPGGLTVVYSDSDDGQRQERLIATSQLQHGRAPTLGKTFAVPPDHARCETQGGELKVRHTRRFAPDEAVLDW